MEAGIYKITNKINNKFYIGSSKRIKRRWYEHKSSLINCCHGNKRMQNSWNKYGEYNFIFEIIEECDVDELLVREQHYLDALTPYDRNIGFNLNKDATGGDFYSLLTDDEKEEFINKCKRVGEKNGMYGKTHSNDTIKLQKEKAVGRFTLEWFVEKYGNDEGLIKFNERCDSLASRNINYSYDNKLTGKKRGSMSEENKKLISEGRKNLKKREPELKEAILSKQYTIKQLCSMFNTSKPTILARKRKYLR